MAWHSSHCNTVIAVGRHLHTSEFVVEQLRHRFLLVGQSCGYGEHFVRLLLVGGEVVDVTSPRRRRLELSCETRWRADSKDLFYVGALRVGSNSR